MAIAQALRPVEEEKAKERMIRAHASYGNFPQLIVGAARDKVAKAVGMSGRTLEKAEAIVEKASAKGMVS